MKLEELERRLRNDVMHESMQWEGQVLLHRCSSPASPGISGCLSKQASKPAKHEHITFILSIQPLVQLQLRSNV